MIIGMRKFASTFAAKLLFLLLILAFAVWGIEDIVRSLGRDTAVARVGGEAIEAADIQAAIRREVQQLQARLGGRVPVDSALREAVAAAVLERHIQERAVAIEADRLGLVAPAALVREEVLAIPGLRGPTGAVERETFARLLRANDLNEAQFLALVAADIRRRQMLGSVRAGVTVPDLLLHPIYAHDAERRVLDAVVLPFAAAPAPPEPDEAALRRFHENNPGRFSTPEIREAVVAILSPEALAPGIEVPEAEIAARYAADPTRFRRPERRDLEQLLLPEEGTARALAAAWREGAAAEALAASARAAGGEWTELEEVERDLLPFPALAEAVFSAAEGAVVGPVQTPLGWHVLRIRRIQPPATRSLDEAREELRREIAEERALDRVYRLVDRVEDLLAGGTSLAEAAERYGLRILRLRLDAAGQPVGEEEPLAELAPDLREAVRREAAAADPTRPPRLEEVAGAHFVAVQITGVIPPALRPFEEVETAVRAAFLADARRRAQEERAAALLAAVRGGQGLADAATAAGLGADRLPPVSRRPAAGEPNLPEELRAAAFAAPLREAVMAETATGFWVAQVAEITPGDPAADPIGLGRLRGEIEQRMQEDLEAQFLAALRGRAGVSVNAALLRRIAGP